MVFEMTLKHGGVFGVSGSQKFSKSSEIRISAAIFAPQAHPILRPSEHFLRRRRFFYKSCTYTEGFLHLESAAGENFCKSCACTKGFLYLESAAGENFCKICAYTEGFLHLESAAGDFFTKYAPIQRGFPTKSAAGENFCKPCTYTGGF